MRLFEKLVRWCIFSVLLALVPIAFTALRLSTRTDSPPLAESVVHVLARGDLLLIAALLSARASGEILGSGASYRVLKLIANGGATIILLFAALYFADVTAAQLSGGTP